ncbi:MAG: patatin-like phospholipase family protein, partial [Flavobacteriales bacterium]
LVALNWLSHHTEGFLYDTGAYGLDYSAPRAVYDRSAITAMANDTAAAADDARAMERILDRWAERNAPLGPAGAKPKLLLISTSGGGQRSMLWSLRCMQVADSMLGGTLMQRAALVTGSSGGLIGAAYYRQLAHADLLHGSRTRFDRALLEEVSADMLNPIAFSFVTNDMFIRWRSVRDGPRRYTLDRAEAFERRLNANTRGLLDIRLGHMADAERRAEAPLLVAAPVSINDGRRVLISAQPAAHLTAITPGSRLNALSQAEAIEFRRFFSAHQPDSLKLTSALRMNASFPYITPVTTLPSAPAMRLMDAGVRDNYGYRTMLSFLHAHKGWIERNTSGVVLLQLRDTQKELEVRPSSSSLFGRVIDPVGSVYDNFVRVQDQDYDYMLRLFGQPGSVPLEVIDVQLRHGDQERISLSWHLTRVERERVLRTVGSPDNRAALERLAAIVGHPPAAVADASAPAR